MTAWHLYAHLRFSPRSALTESLIARILSAKAELLAVLRAAAPPAAAAVPALPSFQQWVLWAVAQTPHLPRAVLYGSVPAPKPAVDHALAALLRTVTPRHTAAAVTVTRDRTVTVTPSPP